MGCGRGAVGVSRVPGPSCQEGMTGSGCGTETEGGPEGGRQTGGSGSSGPASRLGTGLKEVPLGNPGCSGRVAPGDMARTGASQQCSAEPHDRNTPMTAAADDTNRIFYGGVFTYQAVY